MTNDSEKRAPALPVHDRAGGSSSSRTAPVLILGGGIGGLATALALARHGIASRVLERRAEFETEGAGIQLGPNGTRILAELGVAEGLEPLAGKPDAIHARDALSGATLARMPLGQWIAERHGAPYWVAHRSDLHGALLARVRAEPSITLQLDFEANRIDDAGGTVTVHDAHGRDHSGTAVIAADGIRSRTREDQFDGGPMRYAGKSAARAVIRASDMPAEIAENATQIWLSPRAHVVHYPVRGGREVAIVFVRRDPLPSDDWSTEVPQSFVMDTARSFAEPLRRLLDVPGRWRKWALYELPPLATWAKGRIALLGDAAHPTLPFLAQGGVLALEDAVVAAASLAARPQDPVAALSAYSAARLDRATRVVAEARRNGGIYHLDGVMALARNATMKLTPPALLMSRYDWVYGWRAS